MPRSRSSAMNYRSIETSTPTFKSFSILPCQKSQRITLNPYSNVQLKASHVASSANIGRPVTRKLKNVHMRNKLTKQFSFNSSYAQSDSGYETVASVSTSAESNMPNEAISYATTVASSRSSSR